VKVIEEEDGGRRGAGTGEEGTEALLTLPQVGGQNVGGGIDMDEITTAFGGNHL